MKNLVFVLFFIFNLSFAHKDHIGIYKKKLVEIRMQSSYEYGEFNKLNIYGDYANEVVEFNKFKDSVTINFRYFINKQSGNEVIIKYNDPSPYTEKQTRNVTTLQTFQIQIFVCLSKNP